MRRLHSEEPGPHGQDQPLYPAAHGRRRRGPQLLGESGVSPEIILGGLFSGLASTGLHQLFKQFIDID